MTVEIGKNTFPWHLWDIHKRGYTGKLRIERNKLWKEIYFDDGSPVGGRSNILNECLGRLLVNYGKLPADKCEDSLVLMKGLKSRQGETLVKMGAIKEDELPEWLRFQLKVRLLDLFGWKGAIYKFMEEDVQRFISIDKKIGEIIIDGINERFQEIEDELLPFKGMYLKKGDSFEDVLKDFGFEAPPFTFDSKMVGNVLSMGKEPAAILYAFLLTGALTLSEISEEWERLNSFYEKINGKNHFEVLGVSRMCKDADVKKAYYNLAKLYHPDLYESHPDKKLRSFANEIFCLISAAYEVLCDEKSRRDYEDQLMRGAAGGDATTTSRILLAEMEYKKGQTCLRVGNFEGAAKSFQTAVDMNPEEAEFYAYLGWALYNMPRRSLEDSSKAKEHVAKALSMNSRIAMAYYFSGFIKRVEGDTEGALREFNKALRLNSGLVEAIREIRLINSRKAKEENGGKDNGILGKVFSRKNNN